MSVMAHLYGPLARRDGVSGPSQRCELRPQGRTIKNALAADDAAKFKTLIKSFTTYGTRQSVDPLLLAAVGYQESRFSQSLRSRSGAVGIMQIKPSMSREFIAIQSCCQSRARPARRAKPKAL